MDRFDLEQEIVKFSGILDDLRELVDNDRLSEDNVLALTEYYNIRFEVLWSSFESFIASLHAKKKPTTGWGPNGPTSGYSPGG